MKCDQCNQGKATHRDEDYGQDLCRTCLIDLLEQKVIDIEMKAEFEMRELKKNIKRLRSYDNRARGPRTVKRAELRTIAMTTGGEKKYSKVVDGDSLKEWVGIGWIKIRKATRADRARYPKVV